MQKSFPHHFPFSESHIKTLVIQLLWIPQKVSQVPTTGDSSQCGSHDTTVVRGQMEFPESTSPAWLQSSRQSSPILCQWLQQNSCSLPDVEFTVLISCTLGHFSSDFNILFID